MANFKTRDKPLRRVKQRVSTVIVVMLCILSLGVVSSLTMFNSFGGSSGGGTSSSRPTIDSGNSNTGNNGGNDSTGDSSGDDEGETPGGSTGDNTGDETGGDSSDEKVDNTVKMVNEQFFSESLNYSAGDEAVYHKGGVILNDRITYGNVNTENGYLCYVPKAEEVGTTVPDSTLSFYLNKESSIYSEIPFHFGKVKYVTIDFDIWSSTGVLPSLGFSLQSSNEDFFVSSSISGIGMHAGGYVFCLYNGNFDLVPIVSLCPVKVSAPIHVSFVIEVSKSGVGNSHTPYSFCNGLRYGFSRPYDRDFLMELNVDVLSHSAEESESICIDNFQVYSYGSQSCIYEGSLDEVFVDPQIDNVYLSNCSDWILYDKFKTEKGEE